MAFLTRDALVQRIISELTLVAGTSVQTYNQPIIEYKVQEVFDHLFKKRFWEHLTFTTYHTLDGAGGVITDSIEEIEDVFDIQWVKRTPYEEKDTIPYVKEGIFNTNVLSYTSIPYGEAGYQNKKIIFNPLESSESIAIRARRKIDDFGNEDIVPMDYLLMLHLTAAIVLASDGSNPEAQMIQQGLFDDRYDVLVSNESIHSIQSLVNTRYGEFTVA
jgi:hypothetical protein